MIRDNTHLVVHMVFQNIEIFTYLEQVKFVQIFPPTYIILVYVCTLQTNSMASTPRRSSRLKAKQEDKQAKEDTLRSKSRNMFESDSSCDEKQQHESGSEGKEMDDNVLNLSVTATPSRPLIKTNNFTKV